jgi:hypothetical protein
LTIEAWVRGDSFALDGGVERRILHKDQAREYSLGVTTSGALFIQFGDGVTTRTVTAVNAVLQTGRWYHVAVTRDTTTNTVKFYVDGQLTDTIAYTAITVASSTNPVQIGAWSTTQGRWYGYIAEVRIWNVVRSAQQIFDYYAAGLTTAANLRGNWRFMEGSGTTVGDSSGNANNGTATNMGWDQYNAPQWIYASWSAPQAIRMAYLCGTTLRPGSTVLLDHKSGGVWSRVGQLSVAGTSLYYLTFAEVQATDVRFVLRPYDAAGIPVEVGTVAAGLADSIPLPVLPLETSYIQPATQLLPPAWPYGWQSGTVPVSRWTWRGLNKSERDYIVESAWRQGQGLMPVLMQLQTPPDPEKDADGLWIFVEPPSYEQRTGARYDVTARMAKVFPFAGSP